MKATSFFAIFILAAGVAYFPSPSHCFTTGDVLTDSVEDSDTERETPYAGSDALSLDVRSLEMELDGNTFFIINKKYPHAKLAQWGTGYRDMGTNEKKTFPDQLWMLKAGPKGQNYFYIYNADNDGYRIAKWGGGEREVGIYNGNYYDDQLWKFVREEGEYYRIYNYKYKDAKITKFGKGNDEWGTYTGPDFDDQLWKLVPRFEADVKEVVIWSCDNRQGSKPFEEEIEVTTGLTITNSETVTTTTGFKQSLTTSAGFALKGGQFGVEASSEIYQELQTSLSSSEEQSWSRTSRITFSAPAGKNYRVKQLTVHFESPLAEDNCALKCKYKVEESDDPFNN